MCRQSQLLQNFQNFDFQHAARHAKAKRECMRLLELALLRSYQGRNPLSRDSS